MCPMICMDFRKQENTKQDIKLLHVTFEQVLIAWLSLIRNYSFHIFFDLKLFSHILCVEIGIEHVSKEFKISSGIYCNDAKKVVK